MCRGKPKKTVCSRCKNKRPSFRDYMAKTLTLKIEHDNWGYIFCKQCGQYYYRESHPDNFFVINGALVSGTLIARFFFFSPIMLLPAGVRTPFIVLSLCLGFYLANLVRYYLTKFEFVNMRVSKKDL